MSYKKLITRAKDPLSHCLSMKSSCKEMTSVFFTRNVVVLDPTRTLGLLYLSKYGPNLARILSRRYLIPGFVKIPLEI